MLRYTMPLLPVVVTACMAVLPVHAPQEDVPAPEREVLLAEVARAVLERSNEVRREEGAPPLVELPALTRAAQAHADEIASRRALDHVSTVRGRETPAARVSAEGVTWTSVAENLASMSGPVTTVPRHTIGMWMDSPGHRTNLLHTGFTHSGVGVARANDAHRTVYVVQVYAAVRTRP